jgi:hypothetical protein
VKVFAQKKARLRAMPWLARLVYSIFLLFTIAGLELTLGLTHSMVGIGLEELDSYYAGVEAETSPTLAAPEQNGLTNDAQGGLVLELPPEAQATAAPEPMAARRLLEITHFHLFSIPVVYLILAHLYMLTQAGERRKAAWISVGAIATAMHIAAPWIARQWPGGASKLVYASSGAMMLLSYTVMCLRPLWDMWMVRDPSPADPQT